MMTERRTKTRTPSRRHWHLGHCAIGDWTCRAPAEGRVMRCVRCGQDVCGACSRRRVNRRRKITTFICADCLDE